MADFDRISLIAFSYVKKSKLIGIPNEKKNTKTKKQKQGYKADHFLQQSVSILSELDIASATNKPAKYHTLVTNSKLPHGKYKTHKHACENKGENKTFTFL